MYIFLKFVSWKFQLFPRKWSLFFGRMLGSFFYYIIPLRKSVALKNISIAFPDQFKSEMDSAGAIFQFISYEGALHGFSNPAADERGKKFNLPLAYNENADRKSWEAMKTLFERVL